MKVRLKWIDSGEIVEGTISEKYLEVDEKPELDDSTFHMIVIEIQEKLIIDINGEEFEYERGGPGLWYEVNESQTPISISTEIFL